MTAGYNNYETSYTSYGAAGGAGGGGFIPGDASQQSPGGRREFSQDSLRPVTIKQILEAQADAGGSDVFKIDGTVVTQVQGDILSCYFALTSLSAHCCRSNTQYLNADYAHEL